MCFIPCCTVFFSQRIKVLCHNVSGFPVHLCVCPDFIIVILFGMDHIHISVFAQLAQLAGFCAGILAEEHLAVCLAVTVHHLAHRDFRSRCFHIGLAGSRLVSFGFFGFRIVGVRSGGFRFISRSRFRSRCRFSSRSRLRREQAPRRVPVQKREQAPRQVLQSAGTVLLQSAQERASAENCPRRHCLPVSTDPGTQF